MDLRPIWDAVDLHRAIADNLEMHAKTLGGDLPETDYTLIAQTLNEAYTTLQEMGDRESHTVTRQHASKCRVIARRCRRAHDLLTSRGSQ